MLLYNSILLLAFNLISSIISDFIPYEAFMKHHWMGNLTSNSLSIKAFPIKERLISDNMTLSVVVFEIPLKPFEAPADLPEEYKLFNIEKSNNYKLFPHVLFFFLNNLNMDTLYKYFFLPITNNTSEEYIKIYYRNLSLDNVYTFKTLPPPLTPYNFTFAFASCAKTGSEHPIFREIAEIPDLLFFFHMGDLHYLDIWQNSTASFIDGYFSVFTSETQRFLYNNFPLIYLWDDHDFGKNNADGNTPSREAALQIYKEFVPHLILNNKLDDKFNQLKPQPQNRRLLNNFLSGLQNRTKYKNTTLNKVPYTITNPQTSSKEKCEDPLTILSDIKLEIGPDLNMHYNERFRKMQMTNKEEQFGLYHSFMVGRTLFILMDTRTSRAYKGENTILGPEQFSWVRIQIDRAANEPHVKNVIFFSSVPWIGETDWDDYKFQKALLGDLIETQLIAKKKFVLMICGDAHMVGYDDGSNNDFGGFPVVQAASLDQTGSCKGGPFSHGAFPGKGGFGIIEIIDFENPCIHITGRKDKTKLFEINSCLHQTKSKKKYYCPLNFKEKSILIGCIFGGCLVAALLMLFCYFYANRLFKSNYDSYTPVSSLEISVNNSQITELEKDQRHGITAEPRESKFRISEFKRVSEPKVLLSSERTSLFEPASKKEVLPKQNMFDNKNVNFDNFIGEEDGNVRVRKFKKININDFNSFDLNEKSASDMLLMREEVGYEEGSKQVFNIGLENGIKK